jgi:hypothetical protein
VIYWKHSTSLHSLSERNFEGSWYVYPCIWRCLNCASPTHFFVRLSIFLLLYITFRHGQFTFTAIALINTNYFFKYLLQFLPIRRSQLLASIIIGLGLVGGRWDTKEVTCKHFMTFYSTVPSFAPIYASTFTAQLSLFIITKTFIILLLKCPFKLTLLWYHGVYVTPVLFESRFSFKLSRILTSPFTYFFVRPS